jgi:hypothetical protein
MRDRADREVEELEDTRVLDADAARVDGLRFWRDAEAANRVC